jgi:phosphatidylglycerol:prolipoprotein diacylglycerol transferase
LLTLYGIFRVSVEFLREPDAQLGFLPGGITMGQALSVPLVIGGIALAVWSMWRGLPEKGRPVAEKASR